MRAATEKRNSAEDGFSLIELVVVIAILGILISLALPALTNIQRDAKINTIKNLLTTIAKECAVAGLRKTSGDPTFGDIRAWKTHNIYGPSTGHPGWGWKNWTYDSGLFNSDHIRDGYPCYSLAAMSTERADANGIMKREFPEFYIRYDPATNELEKRCVVKHPGFTYNEEHCRVTGPPGQWGPEGSW